MDLETKTFQAGDGEDLDERKLIENLGQIVKEEFDNIKELTDMEDGLRFALHRLLDLKQIQYEYLKNPYY